ncbi:hypothetical protein GCM10010129_73050 [Streptomyces fumigatiscleroticus]|nr:hypothetical protein GCM10010129_73050 [Streptomyces fumigatiscleroticus]
MIEAALDAGITTSWVTGDEAHGQDLGLRALLEARRIGYVLAVARSTRMSSIPSVERSGSRSRISSDRDRAIVHSW